MKRTLFLVFLGLVLVAGLFAQGANDTVFLNQNDTPSLNDASASANTTAVTMNDPWAKDGKICTFINVYIKTPVMIILFLVFLLGVATISGAAFPQWRNYGSKMLLGSIGAAVLYIVGMSALQFLTGLNVCGLAP